MKSLGVFGFLAFLACCVATAGAATLNVGAGKTYSRIQDALNVANDGDTVLVDPGTYLGNAGTMQFDGQNNITVKASSGRPVLDMGPDHGVSVWGKGIIMISANSNNIAIDGFEIKNAFGRDQPPYNDNSHNGAGIRWDGGGLLRVSNCVIHDCEDGILGTTTKGGDFLMENTVMYKNGSTLAKNGTHNVYLGGGGEGGINSATVQYCWAYNASVVHSLKITAKTTKILYNRIGDEITNGSTTPPTTGGVDGNAIDLPHGGLTYIIGNLIIQGYSAIDGNVVRYGEEGIFASYSSQMYVLYNTFIGQRDMGQNNYLVISAGASPAYLANNAYINYNSGDPLYTGSIMSNPTLLNSNFAVYEHQGAPNPDPGMVNYAGGPAPYSASAIDVHLLSTSPCINKATLPGAGPLSAAGPDGFSLMPTKHYVHPAGAAVNAVPAVLPSCVNRNSATDSGMYNFNNNPTANQAPIVSAGPSVPPMAALGFTNRPIATVNGVLMGAASDDGLPSGTLTYTWTKVSGPGTVTFANANALVTTANFSVAGVYVLQLAANDGALTGTAQCTVQAEQAPVLTVPADMTVAVGAPAHLVGTATDSDGPNPLPTLPGTWAEVYRNNLDSPGYVATWNPTPVSSLTEDVSFSLPGTYLVRLTASDGLLYSVKTVKITVGGVAPNQAPVVTKGAVPAFAYETWTVNLSATAVDPDGDAMTYLWARTAGKTAVITNGTTLNASVTIPTLTLRTDTPMAFTCTATDNKSPALSGSASVTVNAYVMGDITHDGYVNVGDLQGLVAAWNQHASGLAPDLNGDTYVNVGDLQALVANWGRQLN